MHPLRAIVGEATTIGQVVGPKVGEAGAATTTPEPTTRVNDARLRREKECKEYLGTFYEYRLVDLNDKPFDSQLARVSIGTALHKV